MVFFERKPRKGRLLSSLRRNRSAPIAKMLEPLRERFFAYKDFPGKRKGHPRAQPRWPFLVCILSASLATIAALRYVWCFSETGHEGGSREMAKKVRTNALSRLRGDGEGPWRTIGCDNCLILLMPPVFRVFRSWLFDWRSSLLPPPRGQPNRWGTPVRPPSLP